MDETRNILSQIVEPADLHRFNLKELEELAREVRQAILANVSQTGGHLSSNLGTVELTIALYASFKMPPDKVIWDTGHQAYPHKMLTGRWDKFETLRKHGGLSGFLRRSEHPLDHFGAGHAGTAISAALGFAMARDRLGTGERVAAVTGDAAIASGMSWEALNHAGESGVDLTVVLNDNRMSIAPNVGALKNYLAKLRSRPMLQDLAHRAKEVVRKMPDPMARVAAGLRHGITHYLAPTDTGTIFEEMGLEYIGPVDGHDLGVLIEVLRNVRDLSGPTFVHAITVKGKGYEAAEEDSRKWHGVAPFELEGAGLSKSAGPVTFMQAFGDAVLECAKGDPRIVAITAAMPDGTGLTRYAAELPEQYVDVGIAEQHAVTLAAGMAAGGLRPFCAIYSTFLQRGFDQVLHDVALQNLPVRFFLDRAGLVGDDGPTHHGAFDISYLTMMPNMALMAPRDTTELREMTAFAATYDDGPLAVRYPRGAAEIDLPEARTQIELRRAETLIPPGKDATILAVGSMVGPAYLAARALESEGLSIGVLNMRFVSPLDWGAVRNAAETSHVLITAEENVRRGGFGEMVREGLSESHPSTQIKIIALPDAFVEHGTQPILRAECGLDAESLKSAIRKTLKSSKPAAR